MTPSLDMLRGCLHALTRQHGDGLQLQHLYELFPDTPKGVIASRLGTLARRGELESVDKTHIRYTGQPTLNALAPTREKAWRLIRIQQPGWTVADIACVIKASPNHVARYVEFLLHGGYVALVGKKGTAPRYRTTAKGVQERFAPQPEEKIRPVSCREKGGVKACAPHAHAGAGQRNRQGTGDGTACRPEHKVLQAR